MTGYLGVGLKIGAAVLGVGAAAYGIRQLYHWRNNPNKLNGNAPWKNLEDEDEILPEEPPEIPQQPHEYHDERLWAQCKGNEREYAVFYDYNQHNAYTIGLNGVFGPYERYSRDFGKAIYQNPKPGVFHRVQLRQEPRPLSSTRVGVKVTDSDGKELIQVQPSLLQNESPPLMPMSIPSLQFITTTESRVNLSLFNISPCLKMSYPSDECLKLYDSKTSLSKQSSLYEELPVGGSTTSLFDPKHQQFYYSCISLKAEIGESLPGSQQKLDTDTESFQSLSCEHSSSLSHWLSSENPTSFHGHSAETSTISPKGIPTEHKTSLVNCLHQECSTCQQAERSAYQHQSLPYENVCVTSHTSLPQSLIAENYTGTNHQYAACSVKPLTQSRVRLFNSIDQQMQDFLQQSIESIHVQPCLSSDGSLLSYQTQSLLSNPRGDQSPSFKMSSESSANDSVLGHMSSQFLHYSSTEYLLTDSYSSKLTQCSSTEYMLKDSSSSKSTASSAMFECTNYKTQERNFQDFEKTNNISPMNRYSVIKMKKYNEKESMYFGINQYRNRLKPSTSTDSFFKHPNVHSQTNHLSHLLSSTDVLSFDPTRQIYPSDYLNPLPGQSHPTTVCIRRSPSSTYYKFSKRLARQRLNQILTQYDAESEGYSVHDIAITSDEFEGHSVHDIDMTSAESDSDVYLTAKESLDNFESCRA